MGSTHSPRSASESDVKRASYISLSVSLSLMLVKFFAYFLTSSQAILSDALESIVNVSAGTFALIIVHISHLPADKNHPYGHGKAEYFSAFFEGGLIFFAGVLIFGDAIASFFRDHSLQKLDTGLVLIIAAGLVNALAGLYLKHIGRTRNSLSMTASGEHLLSDFYTSVGVIIGLFLVKLTGLVVIDSIAAILVGCLLLYTGFTLLKKAVTDLMDTADENLITELAALFNQLRFKGLIHIHHVRILRAGNQHHIDAHFVLPEFWDIRKSRQYMNKFEKAVMKEYSHGGEIHFHVDACEKNFCENCNVSPCKIRKKKFVSLITFDYEELSSDK